MNEPLDLQEKAWDEWLRHTRVGSERDPHGRLRAEAVMAALAALRPNPARKILDVGCGDGYDSLLFSRHGRVVAIDLASATVADATARFAGANVRFVAGDFLATHFPEAPFDAVVSLETLAHVYDQAGFLRRCADLLVPGGTLVVTTQNRAVYDFLGYPPARGYLRRWLTATDLRLMLPPSFRLRELRTIAPAEPGRIVRAQDGRAPPALLRLAYSYRINGALERLLKKPWLDRARERAGLARTLVAVAERG